MRLDGGTGEDRSIRGVVGPGGDYKMLRRDIRVPGGWSLEFGVTRAVADDIEYQRSGVGNGRHVSGLDEVWVLGACWS